jgi:hypothetical protein
MATPTTLPATFVAGNVLTAAQMNDLRGAFRILQVVQTVKLDTFSTSSTSFTDVTGLTATITPSATSSKVLIVAQFPHMITDTHAGYFRVSGGNATTYIGDAASNRVRTVLGAAYGNFGAAMYPGSIVYLDSPATTSATTYSVQGRTASAGTLYVYRTFNDSDSSICGRGASSITVMEISA